MIKKTMKCLLLSVLILCQSITCVGAEELLSDKNLSADEEVHMLLEEYQNLCSQLKYLQRYGSEEENIEEHNKGEKALITQIESKRNELISHGVVFNENIPGEAKELILGNCYTLSPMGGVWDNIPSFDAFLELCDVNLYRTNVIYNGKKYYVCEVNINNKEIRGLSRVYTDVVTLKGKVSNNELEKFLASTFLWTATNTATSLLPVAPAWALSAITSLIPDFKGESVIHGSSVVTADRFMVDEYAQYIYIIDPNDSNANWELCVASNRTYIQWHVNFFYKESGNSTITCKSQRKAVNHKNKYYSNYENAARVYTTLGIAQTVGDYRLKNAQLQLKYFDTIYGKYTISLYTTLMPGQLISVVGR